MAKKLLTLSSGLILGFVTFVAVSNMAFTCVRTGHFYYTVYGPKSRTTKIVLFYYRSTPYDGYKFQWAVVNNFRKKRTCGMGLDFLLVKEKPWSRHSYAFEGYYLPAPGYYVLALISENPKSYSTYRVYDEHRKKRKIGQCTIGPGKPICRLFDFRVYPNGKMIILSPKPLDLPRIFHNVGTINWSY